MRYGVAGLRFVFGMRSGFGAEEKIESEMCVGIVIVFAVEQRVERGVLTAHDMLRRLTSLVKCTVVNRSDGFDWEQDQISGSNL
jgi:hypothetical protein